MLERRRNDDERAVLDLKLHEMWQRHERLLEELAREVGAAREKQGE